MAGPIWGVSMTETRDLEEITIRQEKPKQLAKALATSVEVTTPGSFFMPDGSGVGTGYQSLGLSPEKLIIPKNYHAIIRMCYDFYQRGGLVARVVDRIQELAITPVRNGQRKTTDEQNEYFRVVLHEKPSRLLRYLRTSALEYFLSGMIVPTITWVPRMGSDLSPDLIPTKEYMVPIVDNVPPLLVEIEWTGWGRKSFYLKVSDSDIKTIRNQGGRIKSQQLKYRMWAEQYPSFVQQIQSGSDRIPITDTDPILRKEVAITPYPTPYLYSVLEALVFKQQLRRMDYAVAARVINAILLVKEGDKDFPLTEETRGNLDTLQQQIMARSGDPRKTERLFALFTNHTTQMEWITPDVSAMLNQDKYRQVNEEIDEGLGFPNILLTGTVRGGGGQASEVSTWAIQPQMEELRDMFLEWMKAEIYVKASDLNKFRNIPEPSFKPIKLQDFIKTAAVFQQLFAEGNISRQTRDEMSGLDFITEAELMKDEQEIAKSLPAYAPTPYSPPPPMIGAPAGGPPTAGKKKNNNAGPTNGGRPQGSQNKPVNSRNSGVSPSKQKPTSKVRASEIEDVEELSDEELINLFNKVAEDRGIKITMEDIV
jgi:hypothetical protein